MKINLKKKPITFIQAMEALASGKKISRPCYGVWIGPDGLINK